MFDKKKSPKTLPKQDENTIDPVEAKKVLDKEKTDRVKACAAEVDSVLKKYNCTIDAKVVVGNAGNQVLLNLLPLENGR